MHIAFLTPEFPNISSSSGGLGTSIKNLAAALATSGVQVSVFIYGHSINKKYKKDGVSFHIIKQKHYSFFGWYLYRKHLQGYLNKFIKKDNIELIEAPDWTGITAFMSIHCPIVIRLNGSDGYFCHLEKRKQKLKNYWFEKSALSSAQSIVSVSKYTAEVTRDIFSLKVEIPVIPNSIDVNFFSPSNRIIRKGQILYFGTIIRKKGILELAHIFNEVVNQKPETKLLLLGKDVIDNLEKESTFKLFLQRLNPEARNKLEYIPEVSYKEVKKYIETSEVIVLPSFAEALPMTWIEAMALEKPMVTSNIGWAKEVMISGKTGYAENPEDHLAYAEKIIKLLNNPINGMEMGIAAREKVIKDFSTEIVVKRNLKFYSDFLRDNNQIFN